MEANTHTAAREPPVNVVVRYDSSGILCVMYNDGTGWQYVTQADKCAYVICGAV